jgi:hypothetical protein
MNTRSCLAVLLGLTGIAAAQAVDITSRVGDAAYFIVATGQSKATLVDEYLTSSLAKSSGLDTIAPTAAAETVGWVLRNCRSGNCMRMPDASDAVYGATLDAVLIEHAAQRSESPAARSDENSVAALDIGLMLIFAFGLLAYPLIRKQQALLHSSVLASYL